MFSRVFAAVFFGIREGGSLGCKYSPPSSATDYRPQNTIIAESTKPTPTSVYQLILVGKCMLKLFLVTILDIRVSLHVVLNGMFQIEVATFKINSIFLKWRVFHHSAGSGLFEKLQSMFCIQWSIFMTMYVHYRYV